MIPASHLWRAEAGNEKNMDKKRLNSIRGFQVGTFGRKSQTMCLYGRGRPDQGATATQIRHWSSGGNGCGPRSHGAAGAVSLSLLDPAYEEAYDGGRHTVCACYLIPW